LSADIQKRLEFQGSSHFRRTSPFEGHVPTGAKNMPAHAALRRIFDSAPAFQPAGFLIVSAALHFVSGRTAKRHHQAKAIAVLAMIKRFG
jgi:hypothetical protein